MTFHGKKGDGLNGDRPTLFFFVSLLFFFLDSSSFLSHQVMAQNTTTKSFHVGAVLDLGITAGKMSRTSISMAFDDFYAMHSNYTTRIVLHVRDSEQDVILAASAAVDLLKNVQVQAIIGPRTSSQAEFLTDLGNKAQVPVISYSATSPSLSSVHTPFFVRTTLNDSSQVSAIASIVNSFRWREAVLIYEDSDYGTGVVPYLIDAFQGINTRVPYRSVISPSLTDDQITEELYKLMTMQTRVFVVHMMPALASHLFLKAKEAGMMSEGYVWIVTDGITNVLGSLDPTVIESMQGVLGVKPYLPDSKDLTNFNSRMRARFQRENPNIEMTGMSVFQLWAYDTAWALAMAAEKVGALSFGFEKSMNSKNSTDLATLGVSKIGSTLLDTILTTRFRGVSGEFRLVDGQLQSSVFRIVNVVGKEGREIGFWTPTKGINRELNYTDQNKMNSTSMVDLKAIIWPGELTEVPKGWQMPTSGKRLRVGVPTKAGFSEFVKVEQDPLTGGAIVSGYCIDVFDAVMAKLPYTVPYDYIPFENDDDTYDNLVYQVYLQNFDAVVGDVTIIANRSLYVDFTLPFTESGVSMIVPVKENKSKNMWIFLKPLTADLWLGSMAFFFFTGFIVWALEHRINEEFRGPASHQLGTMFYFAFSTLVFAHKEKIESNLSRFVVIVWVFVVLILTSSYTASLTSLLTVQQLEPTVTDISELLKNKEFVGYQDGSFVQGMLVKRFKFDESRLKVYTTPDDYDEALSKGSANGGVAAIFDELPYLKVFLSDHCDGYTMVGPTYKTDGFGFVFPRGSSLVSDVSRAILNVTEGDVMTGIEKKWFGDQTTCPSESSSLSSSSLSFRSFGGLFLITGAVSLIALLTFFTIFLYKNWAELKNTPQSSIRRKVVFWAKHYDQKDKTSHTFKRDELHLPKDGPTRQYSQVRYVTATAMPNGVGSQSPFSISNLSDMNFGPPVEGMSSPELGRSPAETSIEMTEIIMV